MTYLRPPADRLFRVGTATARVFDNLIRARLLSRLAEGKVLGGTIGFIIHVDDGAEEQWVVDLDHGWMRGGPSVVDESWELDLVVSIPARELQRSLEHGTALPLTRAAGDRRVLTGLLALLAP